jgi:hypothetical protein
LSLGPRYHRTERIGLRGLCEPKDVLAPMAVVLIEECKRLTKPQIEQIPHTRSRYGSRAGSGACPACSDFRHYSETWTRSQARRIYSCAIADVQRGKSGATREFDSRIILDFDAAFCNKSRVRASPRCGEPKELYMASVGRAFAYLPCVCKLPEQSSPHSSSVRSSVAGPRNECFHRPLLHKLPAEKNSEGMMLIRRWNA